LLALLSLSAAGAGAGGGAAAEESFEECGDLDGVAVFEVVDLWVDLLRGEGLVPVLGDLLADLGQDGGVCGDGDGVLLCWR
jgi:hypothetical protein